jgi:hypothetical protein
VDAAPARRRRPLCPAAEAPPQWDTFFYSVSGLGGSLGAGVQFRLPLGLARLGSVLSLVDAASTYGEPAGATTTVLLSGGWLLDWGRP